MGTGLRLGFLTGLAVSWAAAAPGPKGPPKKDPSGLLGDWVYQKIVVGGGDGPDPPEGLTMTFAPDGTVAVHSGSERPRFTPYTADPKKDPPEIDFLPPRTSPGAPVRFGIYRVDGDTLTLCPTHGDNAVRPTAFEAPAGTRVAIITLKRAKAKD
jgi:uncharacterized protein (TIGR03067 family)